MTNRIAKILTHPGGAHKDELLACSVLLASHPVRIERREPTPEDLEDSAVCVVDVGNLHEPERANFDHHQLPKDHTPTCSLSLVLQHMGLYEDAREFCDWLEPAEWFDCRGANNTAKWLGVERDIIGKLNSPIDVTLMRRFAQSTALEPGDTLWEILRMVGQDLLEYLKTLRERLDFIATHAELWELPIDGENRKFLYMPRTEPMPEEPSMGLGRFIETQGWKSDMIGMIYPDRRGTGYGISRYNDHPAIDLTRVEAEPDVHFAHKSGFVAKTSATESERLKELIDQSWARE